jgi:hypothetical protein
MIAYGRTDDIRWAPDARQLAEAFESHFQYTVDSRGSGLSPVIVPTGWKGEQQGELDGRCRG